MEDVIKAVFEAAKVHGIGLVLAAIFLALYYYERKECLRERDAHNQTANKLLALSTESIKADTENALAIKMLTKLLESIDRRLQ